MEKKPLFMKCLVVGISLLFVGTCIIPATSKPILLTKDLSSSPEIFFGLESHINVSWYKNNIYIVPYDGAITFPLNITYWLSQGILGRFLFLLIRGGLATVDLQINEHPTWCGESLSSARINFHITDTIFDTPQTQKVYLTVWLYSNASYGYFEMGIEALVRSIKGPFGMITFAQPVSYSRVIKLHAGYDLRIYVHPDSDIMNATPGNTSELGINITNLGNARTIVRTEIIDQPPGDWHIEITPLITLEINMTNKAYLTVRPPSNFTGTENITMTFTPYASDNPTQHGDPVYITIAVQTI